MIFRNSNPQYELSSSARWNVPLGKLKYLTKAGIENFVDNDLEGGGVGEQVSTHFVDTLRDRIERVRTTDKEVKEFVKIEKKKRRSKTADSDLSEFMQWK